MKLSRLLALSLSLSVVGCSDSSKESIDKLTNQAPEITLSQTTQKISSDQTEVILSATATDDVGIVHTVWQQISGKVVELQNADSLNASFSVPVTTFEQGESKLVFGLTVTDTDNAQSTAEMIVIIEPNNRAPTIAIESPEQAYKGQQVSLKSNATDQDGEVISVIWEQLSGPMVTLVQAEQNATFSVPELSSTETARFKVTAIDNKGSDVYSIIEVKLYPVEQLVVTTESEVTASAGATVVIQWQSNGKNLNYSIAPKAGESVGNIELTENYAYFTAPKVQEESLLSLVLRVTDELGQEVVESINLTITPSSNLFAEKELIHEFFKGLEIVSVEPLGDYLKLVTKEPNSYSDFSYSIINFDGEKPIVDTADFSSFLTFDTSRFDSTFWSQTFNVDWNEDGKLDLISLMLPRETYDVGANNYQVTLALANNDEWFEPAKVLYETSSSLDYYKRFLKLENIINDNKPEVILFTDAPWVGSGFYYNLEVLTFDESIEQFDVNPLVPVGIKNAPHYKELNNQYFDYNDDGLNDAFSYVIDNEFYEYDPCFENACDYQRQDFVVGYITVQEQIDDGFTEQVIFDSKMRALDDLRRYDIDKDNKPDLLLDYFEMTENSTKPSGYEIGAAKQLWYKINADGGFNSLSMERYEFDGYLDVFDTSQSGYLFDMNYQKGELVEYDYSTVLKQPVIKQIIDTKTADYSSDEKFYLHDVDRDGDLDIIVYSKNQIYWNQNLAK